MQSERTDLIKLQRISRPKAEHSLAVEDRIGLRLLDELARLGGELPLDPARVSPVFILRFLARR